MGTNAPRYNCMGKIDFRLGHQLVGFCPMNNWTSLGLNGWWAVSVLPLQYSTCQRRKNKATQARFLMTMLIGVVPWAAVSKS